MTQRPLPSHLSQIPPGWSQSPSTTFWDKPRGSFSSPRKRENVSPPGVCLRVVRKDRTNGQEIVSHIKAPRASRVAQLVKNPPAMQKSPIQFLDGEGPLEKE